MLLLHKGDDLIVRDSTIKADRHPIPSLFPQGYPIMMEKLIERIDITGHDGKGITLQHGKPPSIALMEEYGLTSACGDRASAIIKANIFFMADKYFFRNLRSILNNCKSGATFATLICAR